MVQGELAPLLDQRPAVYGRIRPEIAAARKFAIPTDSLERKILPQPASVTQRFPIHLPVKIYDAIPEVSNRAGLRRSDRLGRRYMLRDEIQLIALGRSGGPRLQ